MGVVFVLKKRPKIGTGSWKKRPVSLKDSSIIVSRIDNSIESLYIEFDTKGAQVEKSKSSIGGKSLVLVVANSYSSRGTSQKTSIWRPLALIFRL